MHLHRHAALVGFLAGLVAAYGMQLLAPPAPAMESAFLECALHPTDASQPERGAQSDGGGEAIEYQVASDEVMVCKFASKKAKQTGGLQYISALLILTSALLLFLVSAILEEIKQDVARHHALTEEERISLESEVYKQRGFLLVAFFLLGSAMLALGITSLI